MKRITLWFLSTLTTVVLLFGYHTSTSATMATTAGTASTGAYSASAPQTPTGQTSSGSSGGSSGGSGGGDGTDTASTVTGEAAQTSWGPVQVQLELTGSTISKVTVLQYPSGNGKDQEINSYALPILTQETISAQGSDIDMVSGATVTSGGYVQSLQSALDQAGI
jgi:uncharacterized protein with FMN-binding domain